MKKNILVRVDCLSVNGLGHIVRQINLIKKLSPRFFFYIVSNKNKINVSKILTKNSKIIKINSLKNGDLDQDKDVLKTLDLIDKYNCSAVIVDNYQLSKKWYNSVFKKIKNLIIFHDFQNNFNGKFIFNYEKRLKHHYKINELGFLSNEILEKKIFKKNIDFTKFIIDFGSIDKLNITEKVLSALIKNNINYTRISVFLGPYNSNRKKIISNFSNQKNIFFLKLKIPKDIDYKSGIFFGSGGITSLENLYTGKIIFSTTTSINQIKRINYLKNFKNVYHLNSIKKNYKINYSMLITKKFIADAISRYEINSFKQIKKIQIFKLNNYIKTINNILN